MTKADAIKKYEEADHEVAIVDLEDENGFVVLDLSNFYDLFSDARLYPEMRVSQEEMNKKVAEVFHYLACSGDIATLNNLSNLFTDWVYARFDPV